MTNEFVRSCPRFAKFMAGFIWFFTGFLYYYPFILIPEPSDAWDYGMIAAWEAIAVYFSYMQYLVYKVNGWWWKWGK